MRHHHNHHHHRRVLKVVSGRWQRRGIFLLGGLAVGLSAVVLAYAADWVQALFASLIAHYRYAPLVVTPLGFAAAVYLTNTYFPNSQGSGIPQAIAARQLVSQAARRRLVSLRIAVGKVLLTLLGLAVGASAGREGPTVQIGASVMFFAGRWSPRRQPGLVLAGAAAGVAAAFNTPLAGIVFGIEEMSRSFEVRTSGLILSTVIAAGVTSLALVGNYAYFGVTNEMLPAGIPWLAIPLCGGIGGLAGGAFGQVIVLTARGLPGLLGRFTKKYRIWFAALCGLAVAICGLVSGDLVFGTGYAQVKEAIDAGVPLPQSFSILKLIATEFTAISGIPGGLFAPSLAVGAGIGSNVAHLFGGAPLAPFILLGMVAYFSGVVQAPITAFVIVIEMTDNHSMVIPVMMASVIGHFCSRLVCPEGVYHALAHGFLNGQETAPARR